MRSAQRRKESRGLQLQPRLPLTCCPRQCRRCWCPERAAVRFRVVTIFIRKSPRPHPTSVCHAAATTHPSCRPSRRVSAGGPSRRRQRRDIADAGCQHEGPGQCVNPPLGPRGFAAPAARPRQRRKGLEVVGSGRRWHAPGIRRPWASQGTRIVVVVALEAGLGDAGAQHRSRPAISR